MAARGLLSCLPLLSRHSRTTVSVSRPHRGSHQLRTSLPTTRRSTSACPSLAKPSASKKSTTAFGWSVLWITISAILIWRKKPCSPWRTPSGQKCNLCLRNVLLPMSPERTTYFVSGGEDLNLRPPGPEANHRNTISLIRLAWFCISGHGFTRFSAAIGPKLDPSFGMNPCSETKLLGTLCRFHWSFVASPSRRRGLGKRTAFESSSPDSSVEPLSWFSLFPSCTTNFTVAPGEIAEFPSRLCRSNSSGYR